jgi:hypothetical protein
LQVVARTYQQQSSQNEDEDDVAWAKKGEKEAGKAAKKETGSIGFQLMR